MNTRVLRIRQIFVGEHNRGWKISISVSAKWTVRNTIYAEFPKRCCVYKHFRTRKGTIVASIVKRFTGLFASFQFSNRKSLLIVDENWVQQCQQTSFAKNKPSKRGIIYCEQLRVDIIRSAWMILEWYQFKAILARQLHASNNLKRKTNLI